MIDLNTIIGRIPKAEQNAFVSRVQTMANRLGGSLYDYMAAMDFETAHTMNPAIQNSLGYTGMIQFGTQAAKDLGTTTAALRGMTRLQQLEYVEKYFTLQMKRLGISRIGNFLDLYLMIFYPAGVNVSDPNKVFTTAAVEKVNPAIENVQGHITKNSIKAAFDNMYSGLFKNVTGIAAIGGFFLLAAVLYYKYR